MCKTAMSVFTKFMFKNILNAGDEYLSLALYTKSDASTQEIKTEKSVISLIM